MGQLTQHAATRMQQRGIKEQTLECLFEFGSKVNDYRGGVVVFFDKQARKRMSNDLDKDKIRRMDSQMDAYAVISDHGEIITVGHRTKRINRH